MARAKIIAQLENGNPVKIGVENIDFDESRNALALKIGHVIVDALYEGAEGD